MVHHEQVQSHWAADVPDNYRAEFEALSVKAARLRAVVDKTEFQPDPALAEELLGWKAVRSLEDMCADTWRWQEGNPKGYGG